jgi:threonine/homoserine/homoserine lactone efflux protein
VSGSGERVVKSKTGEGLMTFDTTSLIVFLTATLALNLTPGPDMLYVIARSVGQGQKAGVVSALGIGAGCLAHMFAAAFGLSALLMSSAVAYDVVKYAGAAYLVYLGARALLSESETQEQSELQPARLSSIFYQGVVTNVLNPKVALFFLAFLPQFAKAENGSIAWQIIFLGFLFNISGTLVNVIVALLGGKIGNAFKRRPAFAQIQRRLTGGVFIALGLRLAFAKRQ